MPTPPSNRISASSCTTSDTATLTLSASPAPGSAPVAGKGNMRILSSPSSSMPAPSSWGPEKCSSTIPPSASAPVYCANYASSVNWKFTSLGQKYVWAIFYNDLGSGEARGYWGTANGWSKPVFVAVNYASTCPITYPCPNYAQNCLNVSTCPAGTTRDPQGQCGIGFICCLPGATPTPSTTACPWDIVKTGTSNGKVDQDDLNKLNTCYKPLEGVDAGCQIADLSSAKGVVNALDYSILLTHWGNCP